MESPIKEILADNFWLIGISAFRQCVVQVKVAPNLIRFLCWYTVDCVKTVAGGLPLQR